MGSSFFSWIQRRGRRTASNNGSSVLATAPSSAGTSQGGSSAARGVFNGNRTCGDTRHVILQLREHINLLNMREQVLSGRIDEDTERARQELQRKNREGAMLSLRRRARLESQLRATMAAREKIEEQILAIESARNNRETYEALRLGNGALQQMTQQFTIEQVDRTMLDMQELTGQVDEITMALQQPITTDIVDETEIERHMVELEFELDEQRLIHDIPVHTAQRAPTIPRQMQVPISRKVPANRALVELQSEPAPAVGRADRIAAQLPKPPHSIQVSAAASRTTEPTASPSALDTSVSRELQELAALTEPRV